MGPWLANLQHKNRIIWCWMLNFTLLMKRGKSMGSFHRFIKIVFMAILLLNTICYPSKLNTLWNNFRFHFRIWRVCSESHQNREGKWPWKKPLSGYLASGMLIKSSLASKTELLKSVYHVPKFTIIFLTLLSVYSFNPHLYLCFLNRWVIFLDLKWPTTFWTSQITRLF